MPNRECLGDWEWFHVVRYQYQPDRLADLTRPFWIDSIIFLAFYSLGIPYIIYKLIHRGTSEIDSNYNVPAMIDEHKEKEKKWKAAMSAAVSRKEKSVRPLLSYLVGTAH